MSQSQNAKIASLFFRGASFSELAEEFPACDVEQAVREHNHLQQLERLTGRQEVLEDAMGILLAAFGDRPSKSPPSGKIDTWTLSFDEWLAETVDPAVDKALAVLRGEVE